MSILIDKATRIAVQGATGGAGRRQLQVLREAGSAALAGVTPGRGGTVVDGVPLFDTVAEAVESTGITASVIQVPAADGAAAAAAIEAIEAGIEVMVMIAEGVAVHDMLRVTEYGRGVGARVIGPNCIGICTPGESLLGMLATSFTLPGSVGVVSRSGTLALETTRLLSRSGIGQSTIVSMGGDPIVGATQAELLQLFEEDPGTEAVVLLGEIGGSMEAASAEVIRSMRTPTVAFIAGRSAPSGQRMGHLGALTLGHADSAVGKSQALSQAGAMVVPTLWDLRDAVADAL